MTLVIIWIAILAALLLLHLNAIRLRGRTMNSGNATEVKLGGAGDGGHARPSVVSSFVILPSGGRAAAINSPAFRQTHTHTDYPCTD